jgi:hypothetical protein
LLQSDVFQQNYLPLSPEVKNMIEKKTKWFGSPGLVTLWLWTAFAGFFWGACDRNDKIDAVTNRVVLVYLGGDNNLSGETYQKKEALKQGWNPSLQGRLLIYSDPSDDVPKLMEIVYDNRQGATTEIVVKTYEESNSADAAVFASVINEVKTAYPASSYGLILFSHASGWLPKGTLNSPRSITNDQGSEMELIDFAAAIPDHTFDFIIFEACFTAGIEMAYELKDKTAYILVSSAEILSPGFYEIYADVLANLFSPKADLNTFAQKAFNYFNSQSGDNRSATFSIIQTDKLQPLAAWIKNARIDITGTNINNVQHFDRYSYHLFFDFVDTYRQTLTAAQLDELERLIADCVIYKVSTQWFMPQYNGFEIKTHSGLTTYIQQERFPFLNNSYDNLAWAKAIK